MYYDMNQKVIFMPCPSRISPKYLLFRENNTGHSYKFIYFLRLSVRRCPPSWDPALLQSLAHEVSVNKYIKGIISR